MTEYQEQDQPGYIHSGVFDTMIRGYRLLILALGLILASTNHAYAKGQNEQQKAEQSVATSLRKIASTNDEAAKRAMSAEEQERLCGEGKYHSNADLCAQWKAADASADSAWWAWAAGIAGIFGTFGVIGALFIGLHANWIARDTARRQLRAYFSVHNISYRTTSQTRKNPSYSIKIINTGQTPAINFQKVYRCEVLDVGKIPDPVCANEFIDVGRHLVGPSQIVPVTDREFFASAADMNEVLGGKKILYFIGAFEFNDVFGIRYRRDIIWRSKVDPRMDIVRDKLGDKYHFSVVRDNETELGKKK